MHNNNGRIIYRGPSMLDGEPIVVVVTGLTGKGSTNGKTGAMLQTWILRDTPETAPHRHVSAGTDGTICGECPFAGGKGCYVKVFQGPRAIWACLNTGKGYETVTGWCNLAALASARKVRIGAYGDPMAVPVNVWDALTANAAGWTGYTHQWRRDGSEPYARYCMASTECPYDSALAAVKGFRAFRVSAENDPVPGSEVLCPASEEAGRKTTCIDCGLCQGNVSGARNIVIPAHGATANRAKSALLQVA